MYKKILFIIFLASISKNIQGQIQSGPMVGHADYREVSLWVQTVKAAKVKFNYWEKGKPANKKSTDEVFTTKAKAFTANLIADDVYPGKIYDYEVVINGKIVDQLHSSLRRESPAPPAFFKSLHGFVSLEKEVRMHKGTYPGLWVSQRLGQLA